MSDQKNDFLKKVEDLIDETLEKSKKSGSKSESKDGPQAFFVNPYDYTATAGGMWRERRTAINWNTLRTISVKNPIISAIIGTRVNQVSAFSTPSRLQEITGNNSLGFKIIHKDKNKKVTPQIEREISQIEEFIQYSGAPDTYSIYDRDDFHGWLRKITRDSLTFDAAVTELVPTRKNRIAEYHAIDAATIRLAIAKQEIESLSKKAFVQVMNGQIVVDFNPTEIMYGIRNPTTSIYNNGYGISEIEQLISTVTNLFNAMAHNAMFFRNGAAVKGLINIKPNAKGGGAPPTQLEAFKRAWHAMVSGTQNAWKTPILQSEDVQFVNMGNTNREMEFSNYLDFLVKLTCAIYSIDPGEINFYMQSSGAGGSSMFESNQEARLKMSKDKGLRPLLSAIGRWINQFIIQRIAPEYHFAFVGIDSKDEKDIIDLRKEEVGAYKTVDEVREEAGLKSLGDDNGGNLILNAQYMQFKQQQAMAAMAGGGGGDEGNPEDDGAGGDDSGNIGGQPAPGQEEEGSDQDQDKGTDDMESPRLEQLLNGASGAEKINKSLVGHPRETKYIKITLDD